METTFLILAAVLALTWLVGSVLVWRNLLLQEQLIGELYQLTARLLVEPLPRSPARRKRHRKADAPADDIGVDYALRDSRAACTSSRDHRRRR